MTKEDMKNKPGYNKGWENITPYTKLTAGEGGRVGGKMNKNNPKQILSQKISWLKRKGLTDASAKQLWELMTNSDMSSLDILMQLKKMQSKSSDDKSDSVIVNKLMDWHKMHHGDKKSLDVKMVSVNLNEPLSDEARAVLMPLLEDE